MVITDSNENFYDPEINLLSFNVELDSSIQGRYGPKGAMITLYNPTILFHELAHWYAKNIDKVEGVVATERQAVGVGNTARRVMGAVLPRVYYSYSDSMKE